MEGGLCSDFSLIGDKAKLLQSMHYAYICGFYGTLERVCCSIKTYMLFKNGDLTTYCTQPFSRGFYTLYGSKFALQKRRARWESLKEDTIATDVYI